MSTGSRLVIYRGHTQQIVALSWSPDSSLLASASLDATAQVIERMTGATVRNFTSTSGWVNDVTWSPDGVLLACATEDSTVQVWSTPTKKTILTYRGHSSSVQAVKWSPDGKLIASTDQGILHVWEATTGKEWAKFAKTDWINAVDWSPDSRFLVCGTDFASANIFNVTEGGEVLAVGLPDIVFSVAWSPDGMSIASASFDGMVRLIQAHSGKELNVYRGHAGQVLSVIWSPDGSYLEIGRAHV